MVVHPCEPSSASRRKATLKPGFEQDSFAKADMPSWPLCPNCDSQAKVAVIVKER